MEIFNKYIDDPKNKIRTHGSFIPKKQKEYLEKDVFHFQEGKFIVAFQPLFIGARTSKSKGTPLTFIPYITYAFNTKGGKLYLQKIFNKMLNKDMYLVFTAHFFDRYSLRAYENEIGRIEALSIFSAVCGYKNIAFVLEDFNNVKMIFPDGVGLGSTFDIDESNMVAFFKTFITDEMAGSEAVETRNELFAVEG